MTITDAFANISKILERDSKSTTYKFALLRGVIDIILENSPYIKIVGERVHMPLGLMIEKWLCYYYPILESKIRIPQINGDANLAFEDRLGIVVLGYKSRGGFSAFYNDLTRKSIPEGLQVPFLNLVQKMRSTITQMPMKYIGTSINNSQYSIFQFEGRSISRRGKSMDIQFLINSCGSFSIPLEYYEAFRILGRFVNGKESILFKWAEFSVNASGDHLSVENVLERVLKSPVTERDALEAKKIYSQVLRDSGEVRCVWTNKVLQRYDVDHVIPFSIWKNNDLWNLLPSSPAVNKKKRDMIPAPALIERQKDAILHYWELLDQRLPSRFQKEINVALLGARAMSDWKKTSIGQLKQTCHYLVEQRGYGVWGT